MTKEEKQLLADAEDGLLVSVTGGKVLMCVAGKQAPIVVTMSPQLARALSTCLAEYSLISEGMAINGQ